MEVTGMKVVVGRDRLLRALSRTARVVERRTTIPVLSNVHLRADGAMLYLRTSDLDIEVSDQAECVCDVPGEVTVAAHTLHDIIKKSPSGAEVSLLRDEKDTMLTVSYGKSKFSLQTLPASDFPTLAQPDTNTKFTVPSAEFKRMIDATQFAISTEETRYYLNGIHFHLTEDNLIAVATDGHRLAKTKSEIPDGAEGMAAIIIPAKTVNEIQRILGETDQEATFEVSDTKIRMTVGFFTLTSKLIDGTFPDYERVIPKDNAKVLTVDRDTLSKAVDRVSTISADRGRAVKLSMEQDKLGMDCRGTDTGSANDEVLCSYGAEPLEMGFNFRYLLDILGEMPSGEVVMEMDSPGGPALIYAKGDESTRFVLMPMRV